MSQLQIPSTFFKMEVREGFPVGELMKRNWAAQLQVLEDVRELCAKHDIRWFAYSGTLLGAVRHKGFIPWDDDIDICLIGEDYIRFLYCVKDELDDRYLSMNPYAREDWDLRSISRIANDDRINFSAERLDAWHDCPIAIGTDAFPLYYVPRDPEKNAFILDLIGQVNAVFDLNEYNLKLIEEGKTSESEEIGGVLSEGIVSLQKQTGYEFTGDRMLANQLSMLYDQICRLTTEDEADYVTRYNAYSRNQGWKVRKELFDETISLPFEMIEVPSPRDYDTFLRVQYGSDYMTPQMFTAVHDYPYFAKQVRVLQSRAELCDWMQKNHADETLKFEEPARQELSQSKNEKCVVLYYTSVREMMIYGEYAEPKIRDVLAYFAERRDTLQLWWCPGSFVKAEADMVPDFERLVPELMERYEGLIREYKESGIGICDESGDLNKAVDACDLYYGDEGFLSDLFGHTGKPVFVQDYHALWNGGKG